MGEDCYNYRSCNVLIIDGCSNYRLMFVTRTGQAMKPAASVFKSFTDALKKLYVTKVLSVVFHHVWCVSCLALHVYCSNSTNIVFRALVLYNY